MLRGLRCLLRSCASFISVVLLSLACLSKDKKGYQETVISVPCLPGLDLVPMYKKIL